MSTFRVPVSFHVFNRPELTERVFDAIRIARPKYLFITADGPRYGIPEDVERCRAVRKIIDRKIDWSCDVYKNYSEENKGSYRCTSDGISWVFGQVDEAIIVEDDCLPHPSFFRFCETMLDRYRDDKRIAAISGNNFISDLGDYPYSYYFSRYFFCWGWATWKRTWALFDPDMNGWPAYRDNGGLDSVFEKKGVRYYWYDKFQSMYDKTGSSHWDYRLFLAMLMEHTLCANPSVNLVSNIGAGVEATNTRRQNELHNLATTSMVFPLVHPPSVYPIYWVDEQMEKINYSLGHGMLVLRLMKMIRGNWFLNRVRLIIRRLARR